MHCEEDVAGGAPRRRKRTRANFGVEILLQAPTARGCTQFKICVAPMRAKVSAESSKI
jgi:hypothetical protein